MSIHVKTITTVSCDGLEDRPCPRESSAVYPFAQMIALRMARKEGWSVDGLTLCPECDSEPACITEPLVLVPAVIGHHGIRIDQGHDAISGLRSHRRHQATSRSIGSSSASCS